MTWGESVDAKGHATGTGRTPQPWCRYSASCYKSGQPLHEVHPLYGKAYTDGCPRDGDACPSALLASGRVTYKALPLVAREHRDTGRADEIGGLTCGDGTA